MKSARDKAAVVGLVVAGVVVGFVPVILVAEFPPSPLDAADTDALYVPDDIDADNEFVVLVVTLLPLLPLLLPPPLLLLLLDSAVPADYVVATVAPCLSVLVSSHWILARSKFLLHAVAFSDILVYSKTFPARSLHLVTTFAFFHALHSNSKQPSSRPVAAAAAAAVPAVFPTSCAAALAAVFLLLVLANAGQPLSPSSDFDSHAVAAADTVIVVVVHVVHVHHVPSAAAVADCALETTTAHHRRRHTITVPPSLSLSLFYVVGWLVAHLTSTSPTCHTRAQSINQSINSRLFVCLFISTASF